LKFADEQHQLDAHQQQDDVLAVDEDARHREREQDARRVSMCCKVITWGTSAGVSAAGTASA
jgi:hypothetical protein